jgi:hypothetical protein
MWKGSPAMRDTKNRLIWASALVTALLLTPALVLAQDPNQQGQDNPPQQNPPANSTQDAPPPAPLPPGPTPLDTQIHPAGQAVPWLGTYTPLRWGDFSVASFSYNYVNDRFLPIAGGPSENIDLHILRTSLVLQHYFGKQLLLLQYNPQLAVLNGKVAGNAGMDNEFGLGTTFNLTPRFTFVLKDGFVQMHSRQLYPPDYLAVDQQGGNVIQNNFLQNAGSYITNTVTGIGVYQISQRDTFTFSSAYKYAHTTGDNNLQQQQNVLVQTGHDFAESLAYTHRLTLRQSIGAAYTLELLHQTENVDVAGNTYFQTVAGFYALQLSETWNLKGELGANFVSYPNNTPSQRMVAGTFSFVKNFKNDMGNFAIGYTRGRTENNYIAARTGDLFQATYSQHLFKRLVWNNGGGYYRENGAEPRSNGKLLTSSLDYEFGPNFFASAQYSYLFQRADIAQILSGRRNTLVLGVRWQPHLLGAR